MMKNAVKTEETPETRPITREELVAYHEHVMGSLLAYQNQERRLNELQNRPSFKKMPVEKVSRHFRRVNDNKRRQDQAIELLEKIKIELSK